MPGASSSGNDMGVFDFVEEETVNRREQCALSRFGRGGTANPNPSSSGAGTLCGLDKYTFLQYFAAGVDQGSRSDGVSAPCVEIDESDEEVDHKPDHEAPVAEASGEAPVVKGDNKGAEGLEAKSEVIMEEAEEAGPISSPSDTEDMEDDEVEESCAPEGCLDERSIGATSLFPFAADAKDEDVVEDSEQSDDEDEDEDEDQAERVLDEEDNASWNSMSRSSSFDDEAEDEGCMSQLGINPYCTGLEEMDLDTEVNISVEYFTCGDDYYGESQLTFLSDSIKVTCKTGDENNSLSEFNWSIANLLLIICHWSQSVETARLEVRLKPTSNSENEGPSECSGILRLNFTVLGSQWVRKEQKIISLALAYKNAWRTELDFNTIITPDDDMEPVPLFLKQYISDAEVIFEDIIYPKGDPDAVCISRRDIELLKPETFLNDTIIDFYIKFLKNRIKTEDRQNYHFFNSFFFRKLADLDKDRGCALEGRAAFLRVRKWTRKIDIFGKDYIFIPVNFNLHWSLVVICHPGEIYGFDDMELNQHHRVPCILHMDSIKGSHHSLKNHIQSYLWEEWKERHPDSPDESSEKFLSLRFVHLELPQQENSFDCGLFLLHYVELFLKEAPANFNPFKIPESSHFLNKDWFIPAEASCKRFLIRELLHKLYKGEGITNSSFFMDGPQSSVISMTNLENEIATHELQSIPSISDMAEPAKHDTRASEHMGASTSVITFCDKDDEIVSCQLLELGPTGSDHINCQQIGFFRPTRNVIEEILKPLECLDVEKDESRCVNLETTPGICSILLSISTGADLFTQNLSTLVKNEDDQTQVLVNPTICKTAASADSNGILLEAEDVNCVAILGEEDKPKVGPPINRVGILGVENKPEVDSPRDLQQASPMEDPSSLFGKEPVETAIIEDSREAPTTNSFVCINQERTQPQLVSDENIHEPEKPHGCDTVETRDAGEEANIVGDSETDEADAPTDPDELPENCGNPDALSDPNNAPLENVAPSLDNDESGKADEELLLVPEERPTKYQKVSHSETGRRRIRKHLK